MAAAFYWLFDLDNTLHHADAGIFQLINRRMTDFLAEGLGLPETQADRLRQDYWQRYGATLGGVIRHHPDMDPAAFLAACHPMNDILPLLHTVATLKAVLGRLNGSKAVFSNGPSFYVRGLLQAAGIAQYFDAAFGTDDLACRYKPDPQAYLEVCRRLNIAPERCIMVDDSAANLRTARLLGMRTVWFGAEAHPQPFADACAAGLEDLASWAAALGLAEE